MAVLDSQRLVPLPVRSLAAAGVVAGYTAIGTALTDSARIFFIQNLTDQIIMISHDGVNDHYPLASGGFLLLDCTTNRDANSVGFYIPQNTRIFAKRVGVPTTGNVYVTAFVGQG